MRHLIDQGVPAGIIAAHAGMPMTWVDRLLNGNTGPWMAASRARQIFAIEVPPGA
ncbi:MAG: hypothetical protein ACRDNS_17285 [Trebonia sp.]